MKLTNKLREYMEDRIEQLKVEREMYRASELWADESLPSICNARISELENALEKMTRLGL